ncbi:MAG TPA: hypothetical protein VLT59_12520, partial [Steroidobacteraceae bacterium]|nr:hypothetical protein [Steroidobacteraceae bacterium]
MNARNLFVLTVAVAATAIGQRAPAAPTDPGAGALVRPAALEAEIGFWRRIYSEVTTSGGLIHDDRRLDIVYEEIDLPGDLATSTRRERIKAAKSRYERMLDRLATGAAELSPAEARVKQMWTGASPAELREAA